MFVRQRVNDVFNFRIRWSRRFKKQEPGRQSCLLVQRQQFLQASISSRNWLTVTTSVRCRIVPSFSASSDTPLNRVREAVDDPVVEKPRVGQFDACLFQRDQMAGKISAVNC